MIHDQYSLRKCILPDKGITMTVELKGLINKNSSDLVCFTIVDMARQLAELIKNETNREPDEYYKDES